MYTHNAQCYTTHKLHMPCTSHTQLSVFTHSAHCCVHTHTAHSVYTTHSCTRRVHTPHMLSTHTHMPHAPSPHTAHTMHTHSHVPHTQLTPAGCPACSVPGRVLGGGGMALASQDSVGRCPRAWPPLGPLVPVGGWGLRASLFLPLPLSPPASSCSYKVRALCWVPDTQNG